MALSNSRLLLLLLLHVYMLWYFCFYSSLAILIQNDPLLVCVDGSTDDDHLKQKSHPTHFLPIGDGLSTTKKSDPSSILTMINGGKYSDINGDGSSKDSSSYKLVLSVHDFGAKGDGSDDTQAFEKAWEEACSSENSTVLVVPHKDNNYLLQTITFRGPCKSPLQVKIQGTIEAPQDPWSWKGAFRWIEFKEIDNLTVEGGGIINGNGKKWWDNSCKRSDSSDCLTHGPTAITFRSCMNLLVKDLWIKDSQQMHLTFQRCRNVNARNIRITAPEKSPNTDGVHITETKKINVVNSVIGTGDDCISIESGSKMVNIQNITCGPGHGISIGSLGDNHSKDYVSNVLVDGGKLISTTNGVRIKTWQGGSGSAWNIKFKNIVMQNVARPIIIDQNYCENRDDCKEEMEAVKISNVLYKNIKGTSRTEVAVKFDCSESYPCKGIVLEDIDLVRTEEGEETTMICNNVEVTTEGHIHPPACF